jgi:hypothetical protein
VFFDVLEDVHQPPPPAPWPPWTPGRSGPLGPWPLLAPWPPGPSGPLDPWPTLDPWPPGPLAPLATLASPCPRPGPQNCSFVVQTVCLSQLKKLYVTTNRRHSWAINTSQGHIPRGGMKPGKHPHPKSIFKKKEYLIGTFILNILRCLLFSRNPPLKSSDDWRNRVLEK